MDNEEYLHTLERNSLLVIKSDDIISSTDNPTGKEQSMFFNKNSA
uniref:Uncharacterized protein n=1 Tax=Chlorobium phaeobacteroides (strain BS1) TaxID=331678 RepID=B3EMP4_CHLPB